MATKKSALAASKSTAIKKTSAAAKSRAAATAQSEPDAVSLAEFSDFVGYAVRSAQMRIDDHFYEALAHQHITPARFTLLVLIRNNPGIRSTDLARTLKIARSGLVKLVDFLEGNGWITRETTLADRRNQSLVLTTQGKRKLEAIQQAVAKHEEEICAGISAKERAQLMDILSRLAR